MESGLWWKRKARGRSIRNLKIFIFVSKGETYSYNSNNNKKLFFFEYKHKLNRKQRRGFWIFRIGENVMMMNIFNCEFLFRQSKYFVFLQIVESYITNINKNKNETDSIQRNSRKVGC